MLQVCVQKSMSTTWPRNPAMVSGGDPSQAETPANSGAGPRSARRSAWAGLPGHALATTPSVIAPARISRRVAERCVMIASPSGVEPEADRQKAEVTPSTRMIRAHRYKRQIAIDLPISVAVELAQRRKDQIEI